MESVFGGNINKKFPCKLTLLLILFLLSSCSLLSPLKSEPITTYTLNAIPEPIVKKARHRTALLVSLPDSNAVYNTEQMAYSLQRYQIAYFAKNAWAATPAKMLQSLLVQTLQQTHHFLTVGSSFAVDRYNYILNTELVELRQDFTQRVSEVHFVLRAQLINATTNKVIATKQFSAVEIAPGNTPYSGVVAANRAVKRVLKQAARFCLQTV